MESGGRSLCVRPGYARCQPLSEHARRAARTYGAAADHYVLASIGSWDRFGVATVARLRLAAGDGVLDLYRGAKTSGLSTKTDRLPPLS